VPRRLQYIDLDQRQLRIDKALTPIYPFCPNAIPAEAYLPNLLYSVATIMENEQLLESGNTQLEPQDVTATASYAATAPAEQQSLDDDVSPAVGKLKPTTAHVADSDPAGSVTFDPAQFLSSEPAVLKVFVLLLLQL